MSVDNPRSPILISELLPLMKMLSHFKSRWMMLFSCRYVKPFTICPHHFLTTFRFTRFAFDMYLP